MEDDLARVQAALAIAEEVRHKAKAEVARLEVEWTSLVLEIGQPKMKCLLFSPRPVRTNKPWRRTTIRPWS